MEATSAIYESLDTNRKEIRLLTLHESKDPTKLVFVKLDTVPFTPDTEYIALSYVWGDSRDNVDILVNGVPSSISANLAFALKCCLKHKLLRGVPDGRPLPLWVDAISINQRDLHERSEQVAFMGEIYSNATHVFSWLGRPNKRGINAALDLIREITSRMDKKTSIQGSERKFHQRCCSIFDIGSLVLGRGSTQIELDEQLPKRYTDLMDYCYEHDELTVKRFLGQISKRPDLCIRNTEKGTGNKLWNSVQQLCRSPYWSRVWVQQEMALARASDHCHFFFCGRSGLSMRNLDMFSKLTDHAWRMGQRPPRMDETVWNALRTGLFTWFDNNTDNVRRLRPIELRQTNTSFTLLNIATSCTSTDPRDKIYALNAVLGLGMVPNYELPVKDVYLEWFHKELEKVLFVPRKLNPFISNILEYAGTSFGDGKKDSLPSWLPDLSTVHTATLRNLLRGDKINYNLMPEQTTYFQGEVLNVHGCMCGRINSLYPSPASWRQNHVDNISGVFEHLEMFKQKQMQKKAGSRTTFKRNLDEALINVLFQGLDPRHNNTRKLEDWLLFWNVIRYSATKESTLTGVSEKLLDGISEQVRHIPEGQTEDLQISQELIPASLSIRMMLDAMVETDAQIFMTGNGYVGCCPRAVRRDDQVCILNGVNYPVVLRKVGDHWIFVGMCYAYGISYVDSLEVMRRDRLQVRWFSIR